MQIVLGIMSQSPYNRSIWTGFMRAYQRMGHAVLTCDASQLPDPGSFPKRPDLLFIIHGASASLEVVDAYREQGVTTAIYLLDEPYEVDRTRVWSAHYDWAFSVDRATVSLHAVNSHAAHLPLAFDEATFFSDGPAIASEILVLGSPFSAREEYLVPIRDRWGERITWVGPGWRAFSPAGQHFEGFVTPEDCARFYRGAKVVINIHRDSLWSHFGNLNQGKIEATHLNPRFWEAAGCGAFQLCSFRADLQTYAPITAAFRTPEELERKLEYFLGNERARRENAQRVYAKIKSHTYTRRAETVLNTLGFQKTQ
jgi:spore maturation protein CgeB